jgi:UDP-N-acetyl-D-mannosaminuronic acid dehydrogenase
MIVGDPEQASPRRAAEFTSLEDKLASRSATVCVIGLGYVGLTVACALGQAGFDVVGIDTDADKVARVSRGEYPLHGAEPSLPDLMTDLVTAGKLRATRQFSACAEADVVLVVVQTPVEPFTHTPALDALRSAVTSAGAFLKPTTLFVIESTIPPGTMRDEIVPLLERSSGLSADVDVLVACCPERVMPGKLLSNLAQCNRVIGGWTPQAGAVAATLYRSIVGAELDVTDCLTAELVKTTENAYRDVQIAFANEIALLCEDYGADVFEVRKLVRKSPHRDMHVPGSGVGGHCIPKDPWLLVAGASELTPVRLIPAARAVNDSMPEHVGMLAEATLGERGRSLEDSRVVVLGYTYLENTNDTRNSPSAELIAWLRARGAITMIHDPHVPGLDINLVEASSGADCLILMVAHADYSELELETLGAEMRNRVLIDGRHFFRSEAVTSAGFVYRGVGVGR